MPERMILKTDPSLCTQCFNCQLICSITYAGVFSPSLARVQISSGGPSITFKEDCVRCDLCARYCPYGAIVAKKVAE